MLVQIPVFFGFYSMLGKAVELRNVHFLWVKDLSQPDTVAMIFGYPLNILPLCMMMTMVGQMALSPKPNDPVQQQVAMFMPIIFIAFCYNYASALALYLTVQNLFSIVQLCVTRNQATPVLQKAAGPIKKRRSTFAMTLNPRETLDTMLGLLGFICQIEEAQDDHGVHLQVYSGEKDRLIGKNGELLDDIQLLLNRVLQARDKHAPKVLVDMEHYRGMKEDGLAQRVRKMAESSA